MTVRILRGGIYRVVGSNKNGNPCYLMELERKHEFNGSTRGSIVNHVAGETLRRGLQEAE